MMGVLAFIGLVLIIFSFAVIVSALCVSIPRTKEEDEEQIRYAQEWLAKKREKKLKR